MKFDLANSYVLTTSALIVTGIICTGWPAAWAETQTEDRVITLERFGCFGTCPEYRLRIDGSGEIAYVGRRFVVACGPRHRKVNPSAVDELLNRADRLGYFDLLDRYDKFKNPCPDYWTDNPTVVTSVSHAGRSKIVRHYHGCRGMPELEALSDFENAIDEAAGTGKWIGCRKWRWSSRGGCPSNPRLQRPAASGDAETTETILVPRDQHGGR